ncbi:MAG: ABC transporter permease [Bacteroidota bacterium]
MLKNNIKITLRNFWNNKFYGSINIIGLTMGLTAALLIILYIQHELSYDQFLEDADRIHQVTLTSSYGGEEFSTSNTPPPVGETMQAEFPEIESYTRHHILEDVVMRHEDNFFTESNVWVVDSNFLEFFSFPLIEGDRKTCLEGVTSVVLTERIAKKYFGSESAIGQTIELKGSPFTVTAVLEDLPRNSSLQFDVLAPTAASGAVDRFSWSWVWLQMDTYVKTKEAMTDEQRATLEAKFPAMVRQHAASAYARLGIDLDEYFAQGNRREFYLNPMTDVRLRSASIYSRLPTKGDIQDVYIFGTIGFFILLLACINFMNLATARSMGRAKEVGVRKMLGSKRSTLIQQFLSEAMLYSLLAGFIAVGLVYLFLPFFNSIMHQSLRFSDLWNIGSMLAVVGLPIVAGLLAGSYPSIYLSNFKPISVLRSRMSTSKGQGAGVRNGLVVFQFSISVALVICTLVVLQQINFTKNGDLGMDKEQLLVLPNVSFLGEKQQSFKQELLKLPAVQNVTISTDLPSKNAFGDSYATKPEEGSDQAAQDVNIYSYQADDDFLPTMGIELAAGRNFDEARGMDANAVIVNEATVDYVGWEDPIGKRLLYPGDAREYIVIGVMKNFHPQSLRQSIEPFAIFHESSESYDLGRSYIAAKIQAGEERAVLDEVKQLWANLAPQAPFNFSFLDEDINAQYQSEERLASMLSTFTFLSIFIACLGLLGLITYITQQRTKEIGIRKVLGASVGNVVALLSKDFIKLVLIAFVIATPVAYYFMNDWLQDFAYRVELQWWTFALAGLAAIGIALLTVSFQSVRAALMSPVQSLKNE